MKRISKLIAVSLTAAAIICSMASGADCYSAIGSRGTEVRNIQQRLKDWGYYSGSVDGIYGTATKAAVIKFQKKHKITADGICGKKNSGADRSADRKRFLRQFDRRLFLVWLSTACKTYISWSTRRALLRSGGGRCSCAQSNWASFIPEFNFRSNIPEGRFQLYRRRAVLCWCRRQCLFSCKRCAKRSWSERRCYLLFQSVHRDQQMDMEQTTDNRNRQAQILFLIFFGGGFTSPKNYTYIVSFYLLKWWNVINRILCLDFSWNHQRRDVLYLIVKIKKG